MKKLEKKRNYTQQNISLGEADQTAWDRLRVTGIKAVEVWRAGVRFFQKDVDKGVPSDKLAK